MARTVVVGVEGTDSSHDALIWAAHAAAARRDELEIVYAVGVPYSSMEVLYDDAVTQSAETLLDDEKKRALDAEPDLTVRTTLSRTTPARALTELSEEAALVVVGSHPLGFMERVFAGSLSYQVVAGCHSPVLVVPEGTGARGAGVVVGADGSPDSVTAVAHAAEEADRLGSELTVVHAWLSPVTYLSVDVISGSTDELVEESERMMLAESIAGLGERYPDLTINRRLVHDNPAQALLEAAVGARLLVVGSRGLHGVTRMLLGSVSHTVVMHAPCPVLVVRS
ncbi:universal stress proteinc [mine drainage metagenome]|uniref:Universal stress proteinc n=1 Tax=mine drainage metagenome TaxID=410659 RepID=A0A1J5Q9I7_9ZZZZ